MELLQNLGIDWRLLTAQLVNFTILLAVLYKFLYKPVLKVLHERSTKIAQSLKDAAEAEKKLGSAGAVYEQKILEAKGTAQEIVEKMQKEVEAERAQLVEKAHAESEKILESGRKQLIVEKEEMLQDAKDELTDLVAMATEHVLGEVVTQDIDKKLIQQAVSKVRIGRA